MAERVLNAIDPEETIAFLPGTTPGFGSFLVLNDGRDHREFARTRP